MHMKTNEKGSNAILSVKLKEVMANRGNLREYILLYLQLNMIRIKPHWIDHILFMNDYFGINEALEYLHNPDKLSMIQDIDFLFEFFQKRNYKLLTENRMCEDISVFTQDYYRFEKEYLQNDRLRNLGVQFLVEGNELYTTLSSYDIEKISNYLKRALKIKSIMKNVKKNGLY